MKKVITTILIVLIAIILLVVAGTALKLYFDGKDFEKGDLLIFYSNDMGLHSEIASYDQTSLKKKGVKYYNFSGLKSGPGQIIVDKEKVLIAPVGDFKNSDYRKILSINYKGDIQEKYNIDGDISPTAFIVTDNYLYTYSNLNYEFFIKKIDRTNNGISTIKANNNIIGVSGLTYCNNDVYGTALDLKSSTSKIYKYDFDKLKEIELYEIGSDEDTLEYLVCRDSKLYYAYNGKILYYDTNIKKAEVIVSLLSKNAIDITIKDNYLFVTEADPESNIEESTVEIFDINNNKKVSEIKIEGYEIQSSIDLKNNLWILYSNEEHNYLVKYDYMTGKELTKLKLDDKKTLYVAGFAIK